MIYTLHTIDNFIYAYVVFRTVDEFGKAKNKGEYVYIERVWINEEYRNGETLNKLIRHIDNHPETVNVKWVYWEKEKYNDKLSKTYSRDKFIKNERVLI